MSTLSVSNDNFLNLKEYSNTNFELENNIIYNTHTLNPNSENLNLEINKTNNNLNKNNIDETLNKALEVTGGKMYSDNNLKNLSKNENKLQNKYIQIENTNMSPSESQENTIVTNTLNDIAGNNRNINNNKPTNLIRNEIMTIFPLSIIIMLIIFLLLLIYVISFQ